MTDPAIYLRPGDAPDLTDEIGIICMMVASDFDTLKGERPSWSDAHEVWTADGTEPFGNEKPAALIRRSPMAAARCACSATVSSATSP